VTEITNSQTNSSNQQEQARGPTASKEAHLIFAKKVEYCVNKEINQLKQPLQRLGGNGWEDIHHVKVST
jgi:hypothetical protein